MRRGCTTPLRRNKLHGMPLASGNGWRHGVRPMTNAESWTISYAIAGSLAVHVLLPVLAIHIQGDDGTALVFLGIGLVMVFAGGISGWLVAGVQALQ